MAPVSAQGGYTLPEIGAGHGVSGVETKYAALPLTFEKNVGQVDGAVQFLVRGPGHSTFLAAGGEVTVVGPAGGTAAKSAALRIRLQGGRADAPARGIAPLSGRINYLKGADQSGWRSAVPAFSKIAYDDVYPGIDLVYYGNQRRLEYDFVVAPGADPDQIRLDVAGADSLEILANGDLVASVGGRDIVQRKPVVYQNIAGRRREVAGAYVRKGKSQIAFEIGEYDRSRELVIDPILLYSTFLGGGAVDAYEGSPFGIAVDQSGSVYVTGLTHSIDFPTTPGAFDSTRNGDADVFVTKLNPEGSAMEYSTYIGGSQFDASKGIAIDAAGNAYVTGYTNSSDFPATQGAWDTQMSGGPDAFVLKLDAFGALRYSTFLGGSSYDLAYGIVVDADGRASVTGYTFPGGPVSFPTRAGAVDTTHNGEADVFVTTLYADGSELLYSTFIGGSAVDVGQGLAIDGNGMLYVTGYTLSVNFPVTQGAWDTAYNGGGDVFVVKLDPTRSDRLAYATYLGGSGNDEGAGIALDEAGSAYVTGNTSSTNFPTTQGAWDRGMSGGPDAFVTKLYPDGSELRYSTFLGGGSYDLAYGIAVDAAGRAYVTGYTFAAPLNFPTRPGALDTTLNGEADAFVTTLYPDGSELWFSTYIGGSGVDAGHGLAIDAIGNVYVAGYTYSANFPSSPSAFDTSHNGSSDGFVVAINVIDFPPTMHAVPMDRVVEATGPDGAVEAWSAPTATDVVDGAPPVTCAPASGTVFSLGTTTVSCSVADSAGHVVTGSFTVTVVDTTPPSLSGVPADMVVEATGPDGAGVTWAPPAASDAVSGAVPVTCSAASGTTFPLGTTAVTCSADDSAGGHAEATFNVTVRDSIPPVIMLVSPDQDAVLESEYRVTITVRATDAVGVQAVRVSLVGGLGSKSANLVRVSGTPEDGIWLLRTNNPPYDITNSTILLSLTGTDGFTWSPNREFLFDNDGIATAIDAEPSEYSSVFWDGTSTGTINRNGGIVTAEPVPALGRVRLSLRRLGSTDAYFYNLCGRDLKLGLSAGGEMADIACLANGSIFVKAVEALPLIQLYKRGSVRTCINGSCWWNETRIEIADGDESTQGSPVVAGADNTHPIHVTIVRIFTDGSETVVGSYDLDPGEAADATVIPGENGADDQVAFVALSGDVTVTIGGQTQTVGEGEEVVLTHDLTPPVLTVPADIVVDPTSFSGANVTFAVFAADAVAAVVAVTCDRASGDAFSIGTQQVACSAADTAGNRTERSFSVTVRPPAAPSIDAVTPSQAALWPANHQMVRLTLTVSARDAFGGTPVCEVAAISSNEPVNGTGDGDTGPDWAILGGLRFDLRAERAGTGTGRVYSVAVNCLDARGSSVVGSTTVLVPRNQGR
jgi:hypothetical protein